MVHRISKSQPNNAVVYLFRHQWHSKSPVDHSLHLPSQQFYYYQLFVGGANFVEAIEDFSEHVVRQLSNLDTVRHTPWHLEFVWLPIECLVVSQGVVDNFANDVVQMILQRRQSDARSITECVNQEAVTRANCQCATSSVLREKRLTFALALDCACWPLPAMSLTCFPRRML